MSVLLFFVIINDMKKKIKVVSSLFIALTALGLSACNLMPSGGGNGIHVPNIDNSVDLKEYEGEDYKTDEGTYYSSEYISFIMSVKGYYQTKVPFTVDKDNENLRIYDNMYFYEGDYFQLMSSDYRYIWATLKNENTEYLTPLREQGEDIQVDVKKSGVYKIILDIKTMIMDFEYKSAIETPYYYPFKTCEIGTLVDGHMVYSEMTVNPANSDEFMISNYEAKSGSLYTFSESFSHISMYVLTIAENSTRYLSPTMFEENVVFNYGGEFNVYVNKRTYEIRVEVSDPSKLVYDCLTHNGSEFVTLTPKDASVPYIFEYEYEATSDVGGYGLVSDDVPDFYNKSYKKYELTVEESSLLGRANNGDYYFKKKGHYLLTIDLFNLTLKVEQGA